MFVGMMHEIDRKTRPNPDDQINPTRFKRYCCVVVNRKVPCLGWRLLSRMESTVEAGERQAVNYYRG
jgi:hypothetical protein